MTLRKRLMIWCMVLTLVPLLILGLTAYRIFSGSLEEEAISGADKLNRQFNQNLDLVVEDAARMTLSPLYDRDILQILHKHAGPDSQKYRSRDDVERISLFLSGLLYKRNQVEGVYLFGNDGVVYSAMDTSVIKPLVNLQAEGWAEEAKNKKGSWVILPAQSYSYYRDRAEVVYISIARMLKDPITGEELGFIKVDLVPHYLDEMATHLSEGHWLVRDGSGRVLYASEAALPDKFWERSARKGSYWREVDDYDYLFISSQSSYTDVHVETVLPKLAVYKSLYQFNNRFITILLVGMGVAICISFVGAKRILYPIQRFKETMQTIQSGNLNQKIVVETKDEIGELGEVFNGMMEELESLMNEVYESGLRRTRAELKALQSQMDPHFMYNTLETISMVAVAKRQFEMSDMISTLGKLMRYMLEQDKEMVRLEEELVCVSHYFEIMKFRNGDKWKLHLEVEEGMESVMIPKFSLQPIVENACNHGLEPMGTGGDIWIKSYIDNGEAAILIEDNGVGFPEGMLGKITGDFATDSTPYRLTDSSSNGVALFNIQRRLQLHFGKEYGLSIISIQGEGTKITIRIPYREEEVNVQSSAG